jgi:hypothetical protein
MLDIASYQIIRLRGLSAFQEDVVIRIGTALHGFCRTHPETCFANGPKRTGITSGLR